MWDCFHHKGAPFINAGKGVIQLSRGPNRTHILLKKLWSTSLLELLVCRVCMSNFIGHCHFHLQLCCTLSKAVYENSHSPISLQHLILSLFFYYYRMIVLKFKISLITNVIVHLFPCSSLGMNCSHISWISSICPSITTLLHPTLSPGGWPLWTA